MSRLAVINEARKARAAWRKTPAGQFSGLLEQERYWSRRETIARNKLRDVREKMRVLVALHTAVTEKGGQP